MASETQAPEVQDLNDGLIGYDEISEQTGIKLAVLQKMVSQSRRAHEAGTVRPTHIPVPQTHARVRVHNGHHWVTATRPRWQPGVIAEWIANRPGRGAPGVPKPAA